MRSFASFAAVLVVALWVGRCDALCDQAVVAAIRAMHPDETQRAGILDGIEGEYEINRLSVGFKTQELGNNCIKVKFTKANGVKTFEFNGFQSPSYPFTLKDGTLVYKGKESESTKQSKVDGQVKKNAEGLDKVNEQMKEDAKGLDKVDGQEKKGAKGLDKVNGQVKKDAKGLDKVDGQQKKNVKGLVKVDGQQKKNVKGLVKVDGLGKDITITYYIVHHTENVIALYSCSDIATEPAMAFVAVSSKSIEKKEAKAEVIKARNLLRQVGVKIFRKIPFCKDQGKAPPKKRKRGKKARRRSKKTHVKRRIVKHRSSNNHPTDSSGKPTKEGLSGEVRANPTTGAKGVGKGENKVEKPSGNSQGEKKTPKDKPKDVGNKSEDKPKEKPKLTD